MKRNIRSCILIATAFFATNAPALAHAAYPAKSIRMLVPFSPGGTSDTLARILGQKITEAWGQQVVVDSGGVDTLAYVGGEMFKSATGINIVHISYKGTPSPQPNM